MIDRAKINVNEGEEIAGYCTFIMDILHSSGLI